MAEKSENSQKSTTTESEWLRSYFYYFYSYLEVFLESTQFQHYYYFYLRDADIKTFTHLRRSRLTFSQQIPICFLIRQRLREIFQIKAFAIRVTCFLVPEADYRNSLLYSQPHHKPHRLQSVLKNAAARLLLGIGCSDHISRLIYQVHWHKVRDNQISLLPYTVISTLYPKFQKSCNCLCAWILNLMTISQSNTLLGCMLFDESYE